MKALAMQFWEMPATEFSVWILGVAVVVAIVRFAQTELHISRMKRMTRMGL